jgi:hypothetical protein
VNSQAMPQLLMNLSRPLPIWPTLFSSIDVIANRITPAHEDTGGAITYYDHLVSLGQGHEACLYLDHLGGRFLYKPGTSVLFPGKVFSHSVLVWRGGRIVIAHYEKDDIHNRLSVARPSLPTQMSWWSRYST